MDFRDLAGVGHLLNEENWVIGDDIFVKRITIFKAGTRLQQHVHAYDHPMMLVTGGGKLWVDEKLVGTFNAPHEWIIKAGQLHDFEADADCTTLHCIHNISRTGEVELSEKGR